MSLALKLLEIRLYAKRGNQQRIQRFSELILFIGGINIVFKENDLAAKMYGAAPGSTIPSLDAELGYRECRE